VGATTAGAWSWRGTLGELGDAVVPHDRRDLPGLLVLGHVVSLADMVSRAMDRAKGAGSSAHERQDGHPWQHKQVL